MPVLYLLNYIELSYSEITFTYYTFDSKFSALSNFFQIDRIDEFGENDQMPILYLLNYIKLSYSEITFTY